MQNDNLSDLSLPEAMDMLSPLKKQFNSSSYYRPELAKLFARGLLSKVFYKMKHNYFCHPSITKTNSSLTFLTPPRFHYIWLTDPQRPKELFTGDIYEDAFNLAHMAYKMEVSPGFEHNLWLNVATASPNTIAMATKLCINTKSIQDIKTIKERPALMKAIYEYSPFPNFRYMTKGINIGGSLVDNAKYIVVETYGGAATDINSVSHETIQTTVDGFINGEIVLNSMGENYFIGANKGNLFLTQLIDYAEFRFSEGCVLGRCETEMLFTYGFQRTLHFISYENTNNHNRGYGEMGGYYPNEIYAIPLIEQPAPKIYFLDIVDHKSKTWNDAYARCDDLKAMDKSVQCTKMMLDQKNYLVMDDTETHCYDLKAMDGQLKECTRSYDDECAFGSCLQLVGEESSQ